MVLGVIGLSYKQASLSLLEQMASLCQEQGFARLLSPAVLVATCNRVELYFDNASPSLIYGQFLSFLSSDERREIEPRLYSHYDEDCFLHLSKVTAGLDSCLIGESEIQGQIKRSYLETARTTSLPAALHHLFQKSLKNGKEVRTRFPYPSTLPTWEGEILRLVKSWSAEPKILLLGASSLQQKLMNGLQNLSAECTLVTNHPDRAGPYFNCPTYSWNSFDFQPRYDIIIAATRNLPLFHLAPRPNSRLLVIDISMPRVFDRDLRHQGAITWIDLGEIEREITERATLHSHAIALRLSYLQEKIKLQMEAYHEKRMVCPLSMPLHMHASSG